MKLTQLLIGSALCVPMLFQAAIAAGPFTPTSGQRMFVVNQSTGAVTSCDDTYVGNFVPNGTCIHVRTVTPSGTAPSLVITVDGQGADIVNINTGKIWECITPIVNGVLQGQCILEGTAS